MLHGHIFVFGSNRAGVHGLGAAAYARRVYGAANGVGRGITGRAYALPTKDEHLRTLPLSEFAEEVRLFVDTARKMPEELFVLTPVGLGFAKLPKKEVAKILKQAYMPSNVLLSQSWLEHV